MIQGSTRLDIFNQRFKQCRDACLELGAVQDERTLSDIYMGALNVEIFENMKNEYYRDPDTFADTLNAVIVEADEFYSRRCAVNPSISKILGLTDGYAVYATHGLEGLEEAETVVLEESVAQVDYDRPRVKCQLCNKSGHGAADCRTLRNSETLKKYIEAADLNEKDVTETVGVGAVSWASPDDEYQEVVAAY
jgi:hypothetical protein